LRPLGQIAKDAPQTAILLVTMYELRDVVRMTLRAGALGCILKSDAVADLAAAVTAVSQKEQFFSKKVELLFLDKAPPEAPAGGSFGDTDSASFGPSEGNYSTGCRGKEHY